MLSGGGTIVVSTHSNIIGPGGASILTTGSGPMLVYHYYDGNNSGTPTLGLNLLSWTSDGWPYVPN
jgi:arabinan endo-1,5-alpha-L-arabinosidase